MIPSPFAYVRARSVDEATSTLRDAGEDAKVIAGGQSLVPLMRLRLARCDPVIDIRSIADLRYIARDDGCLRVGALTPHRELAESAVVEASLPLLSEMARTVGDAQVRNMGTIGGVLAHGDPAGDFGALALMLDAVVVTTRRRIPAASLFKGFLTTDLAHDELVTEVEFPLADGPHAYLKFRRRLFDWAIVGVAVQRLETGWRIGLVNAGMTPLRAEAAESALAAGADAQEAGELASAVVSGSSQGASVPYKRRLTRVLTMRAIERCATA